MAYESYQMLQKITSISPRDNMLEEKKQQVEFLYDIATDRVDNALINGKEFVKSPRLFDRKIKNTYYQTVTMETIDESDKFYSGDLISYDNDIWLCMSSFSFHNLYHRGQLERCNFVLRWQNDEGKIIEFPGVFTDFSKTSDGQFTGETISTMDFILNISIPLTEESMKLIEDKSRFILIDPIWLNTVLDNSNPISTWKLTKKNDITYSLKDKGIIKLTLTKTEFNPVTDNALMRLCDVKEIPEDNNNESISCIISSTRLNFNYKLKLGVKYKFITTFTNQNGEILNDITPNYTINHTFDGVISLNVNENVATIIVDDELGQDYLGSKFDLICEDISIGYSSKITLTITGKY